MSSGSACTIQCVYSEKITCLMCDGQGMVRQLGQGTLSVCAISVCACHSPCVFYVWQLLLSLTQPHYDYEGSKRTHAKLVSMGRNQKHGTNNNAPEHNNTCAIPPGFLRPCLHSASGLEHKRPHYYDTHHTLCTSAVCDLHAIHRGKWHTHASFGDPYPNFNATPCPL